MIFKDYLVHTQRTLPNLCDKYQISEEYKKTRILDLVHTRVGVVSEIEELIDALKSGDRINQAEELADMLWYCSNDINISLAVGIIDPGTYMYFSAWRFDSGLQATDGGLKLFDEPNWFLPIVYNSCKLVDLIKKPYAYGKPIDALAYVTTMKYLLGALNNMANYLSISLEDAMERNIAKLRERFPDKFSEDKAINRDLGAERSALS